MTPGLTTSTKDNMLKYFFVYNSAIPEPTPVFAGLLVDQGEPEPNELIIGNGNYNRAPVSFQVVDGVAKNTDAIIFPKATTNWTSGTSKITHIAFYASHWDPEAGEAGEWVSTIEDPVLSVLPLSEPETIQASETFQLNPQAVKMQLL